MEDILKKVKCRLVAGCTSLFVAMSGMPAVALAEEATDATVEQAKSVFLEPVEGKYSYSYVNAEEKEMYAFMVVEDVHETLSAKQIQEATVLYIDQKTANSSNLDFNNFVPMNDKNATVVITGGNMDKPEVVAYMINDVSKMTFNTEYSFKNSVVDNAIQVKEGTAWDDAKKLLPLNAEVEVSLANTEKLKFAVDLEWQQPENYDVTKVGNTNNVTATATVKDTGVYTWVNDVVKTCSIDIVVRDKQQVTVNFNTLGGNEIPAATTLEGDVVACPEAPVKENYDFTGWYKEEACENIWNFDTDKVNENMTLYAGWKLKTYNVTFDLRGIGSMLEEYDTYKNIEFGSTINEPTAPADNSHVFMGWYKEEACKNTWNFKEDVITADTTLYARWGSKGIWISGVKECTYTGKAIKPAADVFYGETKLKEGQDYTVSYKNNINAADASAQKAPEIIIKGIGNYSLKNSVKFTIKKALLTEENLVVSKAYPVNMDYSPMVMLNGVELKANKDYSISYLDENNNKLNKKPKTKGNYFIRIEGKGNCEGSFNFAYSISDESNFVSIAKGKATVEKMVYGGKNPKTTLKVNGKDLTENKDYIVSFASTDAKGTATATFIGIGEYVGTLKKTFKVSAAALVKDNVTVAKTVKYEKGGAKPEVSVTFNNKKLAEGIDYTVKYSKNTKLGTASVTVKGKGNFSGSVKSEFQVTSKELNTIGMRFIVSDVVKGKAPKVIVYDVNGKVLSANSDYKAVIDKTKHTVSIEGGKNKLYTTNKPIVLNYQELESGKVITSVKLNKKATGFPKSFEYDGKGIVLKEEWLTVKAGKNILNSTDYEIIDYINNLDKGTATVVVQGKNGYSGILTMNFSINSKSVASGVLKWFNSLFN